MKKSASVLAIVAGSAAVAAYLLYHRKKDGTRLADKVADSVNELGSRVRKYGITIKNRLLHHVTGPNGEHVYLDMYDRQFYEDANGKRVYIEPA